MTAPGRRSPRHLRVFLASPGDVQEERHAVREVLERLQRSPLVRGDFTIEVVSWDDPDGPAPMLATLTPQQAISRALPKPSDCDFTVVIVSGRMGTPIDERKADGSLYRSGTEWEFEDARKTSKPILLYRRALLPSTGENTEETILQLRNVEEFFSQFKSPTGALTGGVTTYRNVEELASRLRTDVETLLPALRSASEASSEDFLPSNANWRRRAQARVRSWHYGRLLMVLVSGILLTIVAWTAFAAFSNAVRAYDAPPLAQALRYFLLVLGFVVPGILLVLTWWWLGRNRVDQTG